MKSSKSLKILILFGAIASLLTACTQKEKDEAVEGKVQNSLNKVVGTSEVSDPKDNPEMKAGAKAPLKGIKAAPDFVLIDAEGKEFRLSSQKGKVIFVHFWAKWCPPCIDEIPVLVKVARKLEGLPFKMVMISLDDNWEDAHAIMPSQGLPDNMVSLLDSDQKVTKIYGSFQFPETYFVNKDFQIVTKWIGPQDWTDQQFVEFLKKLMATR